MAYIDSKETNQWTLSNTVRFFLMAENIGTSYDDDDGGGGFKEQERLLPIANVGRIMKQIVPPNAKISKEGKQIMQECVSEFISFVTSEASDKCRKERRKTVNGDDICWALATLGFDDYAVPLRRYLHKFREVEGDKAAANQIKVNNNSKDDDDDDQQTPLKFSLIGNSNDSNFGPFN